MSEKSLPNHPNLDQYRNQAKELHQAALVGETNAIARMQANHPRFSEAVPGNIKLSDAQLVIARELGFSSWVTLKNAIEETTLELPAKAKAFVLAATSGQFTKAKRLLASSPNLEDYDFHTALVCGSRDVVESYLSQKPDLINAEGGPKQRTPLLYSAFSVFLRDAEWRGHVHNTIRLLLKKGADINATYRQEPWMDYPIPALYGAAAIHHDPQLTRLQLEAGADPNDNESLYHSVENPTSDCTRILLEHGSNPNLPNVLFHALDFEKLEILKLLLDHGANPNVLRDNDGSNSLHWAIDHRRSAGTLELLIQYGADINAQRNDGLTPYRLAYRAGLDEIVKLLTKHNADQAVTKEDEILSAINHCDTKRISALKDADANVFSKTLQENGGMLATAAWTGDTDAIGAILDAGISADTRGEYNATPLHWACWYAQADAARLLLERGATLEICGTDMGTTPLQWAFHGSGNNKERPQDEFIRTIDLLLKAGAKFESEFLNCSSDEVREVFGE